MDNCLQQKNNSTTLNLFDSDNQIIHQVFLCIVKDKALN